MTLDIELLVEVSCSAHRARDAYGRLLPPPEWFDLPPESLDAVYRQQLLTREWERALDRNSQTGTVRAVLARISGRASNR